MITANFEIKNFPLNNQAISPEETLKILASETIFGQKRTLRIYSKTFAFDPLLTHFMGDIIQFQDLGVPEK